MILYIKLKLVHQKYVDTSYEVDKIPDGLQSYHKKEGINYKFTKFPFCHEYWVDTNICISDDSIDIYIQRAIVSCRNKKLNNILQ